MIGRAEEVAATAGLLTTSRLVTVVGPPGTGKTRLALHVADEMQPGFAEAKYFVDLTLVSHRWQLLPAIGSAFGIRTQPDEHLRSTLTRHVAERRALLLLDGCEGVAQACASLLSSWLPVCKGLVVLATSRQPLGIMGEAVKHVEPLDPPGENASLDDVISNDAVRLFQARAVGTLDLTTDAIQTVARICKGLDGLPLAIELAAGRMRELTLAKIESELVDGAFDILKTELAGVCERHRTYARAIDCSYQLLSEQEQVVFRRLAVYAEWFDANSVRSFFLPEAAAHEVSDVVASLSAKSLVVRSTNGGLRYRLMRCIRHFAREKLTEAGENEIAVADHARWCASVVLSLESEQSHVDATGRFSVLAGLQRDLTDALAWTADHDSELTVVLMIGLCRLWTATGDLNEGRSWAAQALCNRSTTPVQRAKILSVSALLANLLGDTEAAGSEAEEGLALARAAGDPKTVIRLLNVLGTVRVVLKPRAALVVLDEAIVLASQAETTSVLSRSLGMSGFARAATGDLLGAADRFEDCIAKSHTLNDPQPQAIGLIGRGQVAMYQADLVGGDNFLRKGIEIARVSNDPLWTAVGQALHGELQALQGNLCEGVRLATEAISTARRECSSPFVNFCLIAGGRVQLAADKPSIAVGLFYDSLDQCALNRGVNTQTQTRALVGLGQALLSLGEFDAAQLRLEEAAVVAKGSGDQLGLADALRWLASWHYLSGDKARSLELHLGALALQVKTRYLIGLPESLEAIAKLEVSVGHAERAIHLLSSAEGMRSKSGAVRTSHETARHAGVVRLANETLNGTEWANAWDAGRELDPDTAADYVLRGHGRRRQGRWGWASLTPTELRVSELVADRLTYREIGRRLVMSPRTVGTHLSSVYRKMEITSRHELADEVVRRRDGSDRPNQMRCTPSS